MPSQAEILDLALARFDGFNQAMSNDRQARFGRKGKIAVELIGEKAGVWVNHANRDGGNLLREAGLPVVRRPKPETPEMPYKPDRERTSIVRGMVADATRTAGGTVVDMYLRQERKIEKRPLPPSIRFLRYRAKTGNVCPAMLGLFTNKIGDVLAVSITLLTAWGTKLRPAFNYGTGNGWSHFATLRIPGEGDIVLCEGIETALSINELTGRPVWSFGCDSNIASFDPRFLPKKFSVADDGDKPESDAGRLYTKTLERFRKIGKQVDVLETGLERDLDWNDVLKATKS